MSMTKKDFEALAHALRPAINGPIMVHETGKATKTIQGEIIGALCAFMKTQNPQFDETRWREFLANGKSKTPAQRLGDGLKLARLIVDEFGEAIETDEEINGADAVDFLTRTVYPEALAIVQDADNAKEAR